MRLVPHESADRGGEKSSLDGLQDGVIWKFGCALASDAVPAALSIYVDCILSCIERFQGKATKSSGCWNPANFLSDARVDFSSSSSAACSPSFSFST
ncbi:unnamed protein product [Taenia asiatica]|uniref:Uncharacterized protein n=1 Tax=Taenia asiatica TaxID=60517 RepID=A0A0R3WHB8_TAEAS|nr:unnamed protein product [Taenia asiatica]